MNGVMHSWTTSELLVTYASGVELKAHSIFFYLELEGKPISLSLPLSLSLSIACFIVCNV